MELGLFLVCIGIAFIFYCILRAKNYGSIEINLWVIYIIGSAIFVIGSLACIDSLLKKYDDSDSYEECYEEDY